MLAEELETYERPKAEESDVAIIFDYPSQWAWEVQPQDKNFDYFRLILDIYRGLRKQGYQKIDILPSTASDFGNRRAVFIPGLFTWSEPLKKAMQDFKGAVIIGPRTGSRTEDFQIPQSLPPNLDGIKVTVVDTLRDDSPLPLAKGCLLYTSPSPRD